MIQAELKFEMFETELLGHGLTDVEMFVASLLLDASRESPVGIKAIIRQVGQIKGLKINERKVKAVIRSLRKKHAFPILASRRPPAGYWWCASVKEMEEFIRSFKSQAFDELHTISKIVKRRYPSFLGKLSLDVEP